MKICYELSEVEQVAKALIKSVKSKTLLFYGSMGVGKTTLIKSIVKALGSEDEVSSPTFSIVNEYSAGNECIYHFDMYRIEAVEEAYNFGIEDYLDSNCWTLIEWPEKIETILYDDACKIILELEADHSRMLTLINA